MSAAALRQMLPVEYPETDGEPMADTLLRIKEVYSAYDQAEAARQQAERRAQVAEAEVARLRALLGQQGHDPKK